MPHFRKVKSGWHVTQKHKGVAYRNTLPTKAMASTWAETTLRKLKMGEDVDPKDPTLAEAIDKYMKEIAPLQADSGKTRRESNARTIKTYLGSVRLSQCTSTLLADQFVHPRLTQVSPDTVRRELSLLSQCLSYSLGDSLPNPVSSLRRQLFQNRKLSPSTRRDRRLSQTEEHLLLKHCSLLNPHGEQLKLIVQLVLLTGLRRGEVESMQLIETPRPKLKIFGKGIRVRIREVPLSHKGLRTYQELILLKEELQNLLSPQLISRYFKKACDDAGIKDLHFHDLRGEAAHRMLEGETYSKNGKPYRLTIDETAAILGNSVRVLSEHYANSYRFDDLS